MYSCEVIDPLDAGSGTLQVVYLTHIDGDERLMSRGFSEIVRGYNRRVPPSRLLFICPIGVDCQIAKCFDRGGTNLEKNLSSVSHVVIAPYDIQGRIVEERVSYLKTNSHPWNIDDSLIEHLSCRVVREIFDSTESVLHAPHGYKFRKLSGREEDIFVRAGNMLREPSCLAVFVFLLIRKLPFNCVHLYIDSFTILSFALILQSMVSYFRRECSDVPILAIENFHSYQLEKEFRIPNEDNYMVLISATTSGGLARKLVDEMNADPDRIVHILGIGPENSVFRESCVYYAPRDQFVRSDSYGNGPSAIIEIGTEEFIVSQSPPIPVRITRNHVDPNGAKELHRSFYTKSLRFGEPIAGSVYSTFSIVQENIGDFCPPVQRWIQESLVHDLPASLRVLVYVDDPMSQRFCSWANDCLPNTVSILSLEEFARDESCRHHGTVAIFAYQDPQMEKLRKASIELRRLPSVHRHYVTAFAFPASRSEHRRFRNDLQLSAMVGQSSWCSQLEMQPFTNRLCLVFH